MSGFVGDSFWFCMFNLYREKEISVCKSTIRKWHRFSVLFVLIINIIRTYDFLFGTATYSTY